MKKYKLKGGAPAEVQVAAYRLLDFKKYLAAVMGAYEALQAEVKHHVELSGKEELETGQHTIWIEERSVLNSEKLKKEMPEVFERYSKKVNKIVTKEKNNER